MQNDEALRSEIQACIERYLNSLQVSDWLTFESCLAADFEYYTDQCNIQKRDAFLNTMKGSQWKGEKVRLADFHVFASGAHDLVVAVYTAYFKGSEGGNAIEFDATETTVLRKSADTWLIVHSHTSNGV